MNSCYYESMKISKNFEEFYEKNPTDIPRFIMSRYKKTLEIRSLELDEVCNAFYAHMIHKQICEKWDASYKVKYSTYIYTCLCNYLGAYLVKRTKRDKMNETAISLDAPINGNEEFSLLRDTIPDEGASANTDTYLARTDIKKLLLSVKKDVSKDWYVKIYDGILLGLNDQEIAVKHEVTSSYIGIQRKRMIVYLKRQMT